MKKNKKILTALLMLIVTAATLTTASYAWFSSNTSVTLESLNVNVSSANGIQISLDAQNWKATLNPSDIVSSAVTTIYTTNTNQLPAEVSPVSTIGVGSTAGVFDMYSGEFSQGDSSKLDTTLLEDNAGTTGKYVAFDLFVKSATAEDIYLNAGSGVTKMGEEDSTGLENAVRIGFLNKGTDSTNTPATARGLAGGTASAQVIWEPNNTSHSTAVINSGAATSGASLSYKGVKAAGTGLTINNTVSFADVATLKTGATLTSAETTEGNEVFSVEAGITKIRIYIWLEGQDVDCEDNASLGTGFTTNIRLMKVVTTG